MTTTAPMKQAKKRLRYAKLNSRQKDLIQFEVLERFLAGELPSDIAASITERGIKISREKIYDYVREAVKLGFLLYAPPPDRLMTQRLESCAQLDREPRDIEREVKVVRAFGERASRLVSDAGAEITFKLIEELADQRGNGAEVHIAFGIGRTTMHLVEHLAARLRSWGRSLKLVVHAITPTFSMRNPLDTPVAAFTELDKAVRRHEQQDKVGVEFVNLEVQPFVPAAEYDRFMQQRANEVDIVITSFADSRDEHGYLSAYLSRQDPAGLAALEAAGWCGDVHLCPYSKARPLQITQGMRPVTLFSLPGLVELAAKPDKHVVLLCAPCNYCHRSKGKALLPLLTQPDLRLWNHLLVDFETAEEIVSASGLRV
jgi:hypothetical protein